ncbi:transcriptional regulator, AlpA family [Trichlorobacter thiogenes]|uniref:Transcriptional regulator, AlpA family n=1 Tax=Trichlorobacter thiogenes TaxID=115783 RepID=A0A1T4M689_9BACT|nr:transcriptional regulator, AlpA family [Trichlorobacter thiogenes]
MLTKQYYRLKEVIQLTGAGQSTLYQWQREGRFPRPDLRPSKRLCLYSRELLERWFEDQKKAAAQS